MDRIGRLRIIGRIRGLIQKETIPYFEQQIAESTNLIVEQATAKAQVDIAEIRSMAEQGFLSQADLEMAEGEIERVQQDYRRGMLTTREFVNALISSQETSMVQVPVETVPVEPTPAGAEQPEAEEPSEEEVKQTILVDRAKRELEINGKRVKFSDIQWSVLSVIYQKGWLVGATAQEVDQAAAEAGSTAAHASYIVDEIRQKIEADPKNPQIIITDKKARNSRYFWHAEKVDLQFIPSELVILEGTNQIEIDGRRVELKRPELVLLNALVSKMGLVFLPSQLSSDAFGNPNTIETGLRHVFDKLAQKVNYPWGDESLESSGKRGLGAWYKAQNLVVSIKQVEKEPGQVQEPVVDIEGKIAEIQRLVNDGVLVSPEQIARAQEAVKQFGGTIEFQPSRFRKLTKEELAALDAEEKGRPKQEKVTFPEIPGLTPKEKHVYDLIRTRSKENPISSTEWAMAVWPTTPISKAKDNLSVTLKRLKSNLEAEGLRIINLVPVGNNRKNALYYLDYIPLPEVVEEGEKPPKEFPMPAKESHLLALTLIIDDPEKMTIQDVIDVLGPTKRGKQFTWQQALFGLNRAITTVALRKAHSFPTEDEQTLWKQFIKVAGEADIKEIPGKMRKWLREWFDKKRNISERIENQQAVVREPVVEPEAQPLGITVEQPPAPKLTERQAERQKMITERVRGILAEISQVENLPDSMGSSRLTWLAKHHLGVTITDSDIQKFVDRGYIEQFSGNDHHPGYNQESLLGATYLRRFGNNMSKAQKRELLRIMSREFNAWQAQRSNR